jgi:hypothetical protein
MRLNRLVSLVTVLALVFAVAGGVALADTPKPGKGRGVIPIEGFGLTQPIQNRLSSGAWAMVAGLDPRVTLKNAARSRQVGWDLTQSAFATSGGSAAGGSGGVFQQVPFRNPSPAFSRNIVVTQQVGLFPIQTEPHIVVNPNDPQHLVLGVIDYNFPSMSTYVSFDGGENWDGPNQVRYFRNDFTAAGDPVLTFDNNGVVYITSISLGVQDFRIGNISSNGEVSSMVVSRSYDGGMTWLDPVSAARSTITTQSNIDQDGKERGTVTTGFLDKPWLSSGPNPNNPDQDSVYLTYTDFQTTYGLQYLDEVPTFTAPYTQTTIRMVRSDDGGVTWNGPYDISPTYLSGSVEGDEGEGETALSETTDEVSQPEGEIAEGNIEPTGEDETEKPEIPVNYTLEGVANLLWPNATALSDEELAAAQAFQDEDPTTQEQDGGTAEFLESERTVQGSQPAVMPDGTLVIAYVDTTNDGIQKGLATIQVVISKDGGETFSAPMQAGIFREPHQRPRNAFFRMWGSAFPQLTVGPNNDIYIAVIGLPDDKPTDDGDVFLLRSLNGGASWEDPVRVNQDTTDRLQFYPAIDVSPNGILHLMWGDMRDDPEEARYHVYYTKSEDQGESFGFTLPDQDFTAPDTVVTDFASNSLKGFPQGLFLGDYFAMAATDEDAYLVWPDTRLGEYGGPNQQIAFARQEALPSPSLFLSPPSGAAGRTVDVQGFGFQPRSEVFLQIGGITISNLLTDELGQFTTRVSMPVTGEGATEYRAFDDTGNVAIASFYADFGFDSVQTQLDQIRNEIGADATPVSAGSANVGAPPVVTTRDAEAETLWLVLGGLGLVMVAGVGGYVIGHRR